MTWRTAASILVFSCLLLVRSVQPTRNSARASNRSSSNAISSRQEMTIVTASINTSVYQEALRVLEVDGCQVAVHKAPQTKASYLLEPLLCWRAGMEQLVCPGYDYTRSRHFLRVPVLLTDPSLTNKAKRLLHSFFPTSVSFMNSGAIHFQLSATSADIEVDLERQLGAIGGSTYLILRSYCTSESHCSEISLGLARQPSLYFEKLRLSLSSREYASLNQSIRVVSASPFACQNELRPRLQLNSQAVSMPGSLQPALEPAADNHTKVVEVDGELYFLLQQRSSGRVSFQRDWNDYENGFGDPSDDYWMGLRMMHSLTKSNRVLRVEMIRHRSGTFDRDLFHAEYTNIKIGPPPTYTLAYTAFNKAKSTVESDALAESRGRPFSTMDRDNDRWGQSCSRVSGGSGGWWFNSCGKCNPNGLFFSANVRNESGVRWEYLDSRALSGNVTLKYIRMLLKI